MSRSYGIDGLRILLAGMILVAHVLSQGGVMESFQQVTPAYGFCRFVEIFCICAVNVYALITGYVYAKTEIRYSTLCLLWLQVLFYSVLITAIYAVLMPGSVGVKQLVNALFPVFRTQYWYISAYVPLFFFIPYLSRCLNGLSVRALKRLALSVIVLFCLLPWVFGTFRFYNGSGHSPFWLLCLFVIGGVLGRVPPNISAKQAACGLLLCLSATFIAVLVRDFYAFSTAGKLLLKTAFIGDASPLILLQSIYLFLLAVRFSPTNKRFIKALEVVAPTAFSLYLIHCHPLFYEVTLKGFFAYLAGKPWYELAWCLLLIAVTALSFAFVADTLRAALFSRLKIRKHVDGVLEKIKARVLHGDGKNFPENLDALQSTPEACENGEIVKG